MGWFWGNCGCFGGKLRWIWGGFEGIPDIYGVILGGLGVILTLFELVFGVFASVSG